MLVTHDLIELKCRRDRVNYKFELHFVDDWLNGNIFFSLFLKLKLIMTIQLVFEAIRFQPIYIGKELRSYATGIIIFFVGSFQWSCVTICLCVRFSNERNPFPHFNGIHTQSVHGHTLKIIGSMVLIILTMKL